MRVWSFAWAAGEHSLGNKAHLVSCKGRWAETCLQAVGAGHPKRFRATSRKYKLRASISSKVA